MTIKARVIGGDRLRQRLAKLGGDVTAEVRKATAENALELQGAVRRSFEGGPATGRVYAKYSPRRSHQASAPGETPASDTGRLASSITVKFDVDALGATVGVHGDSQGNADYAARLEFGTKDMAARPFLFPAFERVKRKFSERYAKAIKAGVRNSSR